RSRQAAPFEHAVETARVILSDLLTKNAVQSAVYDFRSDATHRSFDIDPKTLKFMTIYPDGLDPNIAKAEQILHKGLARQVNDLEMADTNKDLVVVLDRDTRVPIRLHGLRFPTIRQHDLTRRPRQPIIVSFAELVELAKQLDQEDRDAGRRSL